jgi:hypothetical protein
MVVNIKIVVFWRVTPCSLVDIDYFEKLILSIFGVEENLCYPEGWW